MAMMNYTLILTGINLALILGLMYVYMQNYKQLRAEFSLGLLLFSALFGVQKIVSFYIFLIIMHDFGETIGTAMFVLELLQMFAFTVLAWITLR